MLPQSRIISLILLFPFVCIGLIVAELSRALPTYPVPKENRTVIDASGTPVHIAIPFRGSVAKDVGASTYLGDTSAPETLINAGGRMSRAWFSIDQICPIYPEVEQTDSIWDASVHATDEDMLRYDPGAFLTGGVGPYGAYSFYRTIGLPVLFTSAFRDKSWDAASYTGARIMTALIGRPELGEALIAWNKEAYADLARELQPRTLTDLPRVLFIDATRLHQKASILHEGSILAAYLPRIGVVNAAAGWSGAQMDDDERVLAMDPDFIFLTGLPAGPPGYEKLGGTEGPETFMRDPKWRGLKAVKERRVYRSLFSFLENLHLQPFTVRFVAEIVHPDRIHANFRDLIRNHYLKWFGHRFSDNSIDHMIYLDENIGQPGFARFAREGSATLDKASADPKDPQLQTKRAACLDVPQPETSWNEPTAADGGAH